ncbi:MAG: proton-conducting transporter membrane subunit [Candidatus Margulisiibacteriota bacterium]
MKNEALVLSAVLVPVIGAFLLPLAGFISKQLRNWLALLLVAVPLLASALLLPHAFSGAKVLCFIIDPLSLFMALVSAGIGLIIVLYSFDYIDHYANQNEYYLMVVLFLGSMMGLVYSNNLIALYVFWELTAIASWRLIGFYREPKDVLKADKAFLVTAFGALLMLLAFVAIYQLTGTLELTGMVGYALPGSLVALILAGILSKSATLPFHTWLPDAGVAPSPVTALLHAAVLVKIGVYVFARLFLATFAIGQFWHTAVPAIAAVSALVAAGAALVETDIKRIVAYSTVSQIAFIFFGLAINNVIGVVGGLLYILMHGLAKAGLFLSAGIIEQNTKTKDITLMGGLIKTMPVTAVSFLFCAFSVMGIPPFGGFFSKYLVIAGGLRSGELWITFAFVLGACLTILYLLRLFTLVFLGEPRGVTAKEGSWLMVACVAFLAFLSLAATLVINLPLNYLMKAFGHADLGLAVLFRFDHFGVLIAGAIVAFAALVALYSLVFMKGKEGAGQFWLYLLLTVIMSVGAVLANNLILFLFFWEGLLLTLFGMIYIGGRASFRTAVKAFVIVGITDLCLMAGLALTGLLAGTFVMSAIALPVTGWPALAFVLLMIGALAKAGAMPFHSWIPDAAKDAPLPFMAFVPGALEKLLGIYFLTRISLELFRLTPHSSLSYLLMIIGGVTIVLAVMMALIQKDFKKLLSYHAISQVGYMVLGIGTAVPAGIVGGLFHMLNNALYKSCLFLTGGAVEKEAGTTDLSKLGGLGGKMPVTFGCFIIAALAISGVPPFNGFFSKELIYDGALERGWLFYLMAVGGSFLTAASFLKLGHAAFLGKVAAANQNVKETSWLMLLPMIVIAAVCVLFGVYNVLPVKYLLQPVLAPHLLEGHNFYGLPSNLLLIAITLLVLIGALLNHLYGVRKTGQGLGAVDHIHYAPGLHQAYDLAEKKAFDPYEIGMKGVGALSRLLYKLDRLIDGFYEVVVVKLVEWGSALTRRVQSGNVSAYVAWSLVGGLTVLWLVLR